VRRDEAVDLVHDEQGAEVRRARQRANPGQELIEHEHALVVVEVRDFR
jgi:hypothetical protein